MLDSYGRNITYLRLSVTDRCNLRCHYCMPEEGVCLKPHGEMLTEDEMVSAVRAAASLGIKKLRITGGEPLVKKNIISICKRCSQVEGIEEVCMTTNATLLPEFAAPLRDAGVSRLNISLDTLNAEKYHYITRRGELKDAIEGIRTALSCGFSKIKINTVLVGGFNDDEIPALAELTKRYPLDIRFIELMPMEGNSEFGEGAYIPCSRVLEALPELKAVESDGSVAALYHLDGALGNIGLIRPISAHFCGSCNRIRLTADGKLKPCLHSAAEYSIKGCREEEMKTILQKVIWSKPQWHGELSNSSRSHAQRGMSQIGG